MWWFHGLTGEFDTDNEQINDHWPLNTTVKDNGRDGIQITPRWSTRIYYNVSSDVHL